MTPSREELLARLDEAHAELEKDKMWALHSEMREGRLWRDAAAALRADAQRIAELEGQLRDTTWQDHADFWKKRAEAAESRLREVEAALRNLLEAAETDYNDLAPLEFNAFQAQYDDALGAARRALEPDRAVAGQENGHEL